MPRTGVVFWLFRVILAREAFADHRPAASSAAAGAFRRRCPFAVVVASLLLCPIRPPRNFCYLG